MQQVPALIPLASRQAGNGGPFLPATAMATGSLPQG